MSDVTMERTPRTVADVAAGLAQLRVWGIRTSQVAGAAEIAAMARAAGLEDIRVELCADRTIDPALRMARERLAGPGAAPAAHVWGARMGIRSAERLRRAGLIEYVLLTGRAGG